MTQPGEVRIAPRAALGLRQDRHRGLRPRARRARGRARLDRRHRLRAAGGGPRRSARSRTSRASPRSWAAASRRCTRGSTPGCSRCATTRPTWSPRPSRTIEFVDLVCVNLYPFEATAARRGVTEHEVIENIDIGGPTMIRAAAKNFGFSAVVVKPESYDAILQELDESDGRLSLSTRESLAVEAFNYTARYDTAIARWFVEKHDDFPPMMLSAYEKVDRPRLRREPAPAGRLLPPGRRPHGRALDGAPARRQGAVVQQRARPQRRAAARRGVRAAGVRDHQAQQPLRLRGRRHGAGGLSARVRVRPAVGLRRRDLPQPSGRRAARRGDLEPVRARS